MILRFFFSELVPISPSFDPSPLPIGVCPIEICLLIGADLLEADARSLSTEAREAEGGGGIGKDEVEGREFEVLLYLIGVENCCKCG